MFKHISANDGLFHSDRKSYSRKKNSGILWSDKMLNLDHFQQLFNIEDTGERCQKVLELIEPKMQEVMNSFISNHTDILNNIEEYEVKSYAVTLKTTMYDAVNPKSAESKKDSTIGRKYMI